MWVYLLTLVTRLMGRPAAQKLTCDVVLAVFHKVLEQLKKVEEDHAGDAQAHTATIAQAERLRSVANVEVDRARRIMERISKLISDK